ncbi:cytoplasmic protein [Kwoniella heveanensis CBS 569]|nr:cytoplasmic protein [Kwoniella heveanensis CBS 569]
MLDDDEVPQLLDASSSSPPALVQADENDSPPELIASAGFSLPDRSSDKVAATATRDVGDRPKVPLTLLTGYLGAGKSTLLEYILTAQHGYKIAVCMNDFGDTTDIEAKALTLSDPSSSTTSTSMLSLPNGCLCCSFKDMGIAAIEEMVANAPGGVDWVMVELTGVADPGPIIRSFWANEEMGDLVLDGVVCVVDSRNILKQLSEVRPEGEINEAQKQVACADVILLNKLDLVTTEQLRDVEHRVRSINPTLRIHHTTRSRMPLEGMFNLRAFSDPTALASTSTNHDHDHDHVHQHQHQHQHEDICDDPTHSHSHSDSDGPTEPHYNGITTALIPLPRLSSTQYTNLNEFLESVIWAEKYPANPSSTSTTETPPATSKAPEILRTKGYIRLDDGREYVLQGVADLFELCELPTDTKARRGAKVNAGAGDLQKEPELEGKVVFIGRGVDHEIKDRLLKYIDAT